MLQPAASPARAAPRSEAAISTHGQGELPPGEGRPVSQLSNERWIGPYCSKSAILLAASTTRALHGRASSGKLAWIEAPPARGSRLSQLRNAEVARWKAAASREGDAVV